MEKTDKAKIGLAVLLVLLAVRFVLGFFPTPLEFENYTPESEPTVLAKTTITGLRYCFAAERIKKMPLYFYLVTLEDGTEGYMISENKYLSEEVLEEPVELTGKTMRMPKDLETERTELQNWADVYFADSFFKEHNGSEDACYAVFGSKIALDTTFTETTKDNPACFWVNLAAFAAFCYLLAMLLAEYAGRKASKEEK